MQIFGLLSVPIFFRVALSMCFSMLCILGMSSFAFSQTQTPLTIYFYKPEINTARNSVLKSTFDLYLSEHGAYQFQPVDNREVFETLFKGEEEAVFMMSSRHYQQLLQQHQGHISIEGARVGLLGVKGGSDTYRKILVSKTEQVDFTSMNLATSATRESSVSLLESEFTGLDIQDTSALNVLVVPKDIDALMAVGFGLADMALTTKSSLEKLSNLYRNQNQALYVLAESKPLKRLAVVFRQGSTEAYKKALTIIKQMPQNEQGRRGLNMLGLDDWRLIDESIAREGGMRHGK